MESPTPPRENTHGYKIRNQSGVHYVSFAVVDWIDVFSRKCYRDIVVDSLRYCQEHKGLNLHGWCLMTNHMHLIFSAANGNASALLRDFKRHTSKAIITAIKEHPGESRRDWMLERFALAGSLNSRNKRYQFWRQDNGPKELFSPGFAQQKLDYLHHNPVSEGLVKQAEDYRYSSAQTFLGLPGPLRLSPTTAFQTAVFAD